MRRAWVRVVTLVVLLASASAGRAQWVDPGPLAQKHADLQGESSCEKCHAPGKRVEAARCLACHDEVAKPLNAGRGYHATLVRGAGGSCEGCHSDHKGRAYPLIRWSPPADFDHGKATGFGLAGAHADASCDGCHKQRPSYLGAKTTCVGCHDDPHAGKLGKTCESCHDTTAFKPAARFDHQKADFRLENAHAKVACASCHKPDAAGHPRYELTGFDRCSSCHGDPHQGRTSLSPCTDCHTTVGWREVAGAQKVPPAHSPAGWPLVGKHVGVACADCHGPSLTAKVSPGCAGCHTDAHQGRFGATCQSCHDEGGWQHIRMSGFDHTRTRYPLEGEHRDARCDQCHKASGGKITYRGLPFDRCDRCHRGYHPDALATPPRQTACESCHTVQGFTPSTFGATEHAAARFALDGSHLAATCAGCHGRTPPAPTPLALGPKACASCHQDRHGGQFDAQMADGKSCAACHSTAGWRQDAFDHERTAFPLRGVHADAACASCHQGEPVQYKGLATTCEGCHQDPHLGQFAEPPTPKACVACHDESTWRKDPFDHAGATGFAIDGRHAGVACAGCHESLALASGGSVTHFRLGYRACVDCHASPHRGGARPAPRIAAPRAGVPDLGGSCEACHTTGAWAKVAATVSFDHALTGFRLAGRHAGATCVDCHGQGLRTGDARGACVSCHDDAHRGELGGACESCHDARGWTPTDALLQHRATRFPLAGAHAAADCASCHQTMRAEPWARPASDCYACHAVDYQRPDVHPNHVAAGFTRACDSCHSQYAFAPARLDHDVFFPLRGQHAAADCASCHANERFGGTPRECYGCHADDYAAVRDPPHEGFGLGRRCETCHSDSAWELVKPTWHDVLFPTSRGAHAGYACADCHAEGQPPPNFTCVGCHSRSKTDGHHDDVGGYVYEDHACLRCHPRGTEDD